MHIEFGIQPEQGAPFLRVDAELAAVVAGRGQRLEASLRADAAIPISAYRFVFHLPFKGVHRLRIHCAALPRMIGQGSIGARESISDGRRSPLTASYHFDERLGSQSFGLFPPLVVLDEDKPILLISPISEKRDRHSFDWRIEDSALVVTLQFDRWGLGKRPTSLTNFHSEAVYVEEFSTDCRFGADIYDGLHQEFEVFAKPSTQELFWGSWNDGHFRNIDEERVLANADWLKENVPNARWIQVDDGWAGPSPSVEGSLENGCETLNMSDFGVFYRPGDLEGDSRFPEGLGGLAGKVKAKGLRPMIWITPSVLETSPLYEDHPEWFQEKARLHFYREMRFLDLSVPEAREYVRAAFQIIFLDWGFEGCKLDYWSMGFDQHDVECRLGTRTSMEHMRWFADTLREFVGPDGLMLYGIDLPFGSPFRAQHFNQFRYYSDSEGSCQSMDAMREQALWAAFLVGLYGVQRYWVPDGDGLGLFGHFDMPENHYRLWGAFLLGSATLAELAGWLHLSEQSPRLDALKTFASLARLGSPVSLPGYNFLSANQNAPFVWIRHDSETERLISLTNWTSEAVQLSLTAADLGLTDGIRVSDVLTGEEIKLPATFQVKPEDGRVLLVD